MRDAGGARGGARAASDANEDGKGRGLGGEGATRDGGADAATTTRADETTTTNGTRANVVDRDVALRAKFRAALGLDDDALDDALDDDDDDDDDARRESVGADGDGDDADDDGNTTQRALVERRLKRMRELRSMYRDQYWRLLEELRKKHRRFELRRGHGGSRDAAEEAEAARALEGTTSVCQEPSCEARSMPCVSYCFAHVALDETQKLYARAADGAPRETMG